MNKLPLQNFAWRASSPVRVSEPQAKFSCPRAPQPEFQSTSPNHRLHPPTRPLSRTGTNKIITNKNQAHEHWLEGEEWINSDLRISSSLVDILTASVKESYQGKRFHQKKHRSAISMLVANLFKCDGTWLRYSRRRASFYNESFCAGVSKDAFTRSVDMFIGDGLLEGKLGYYDSSRGQGAASLIRATESFAQLMATAESKERCVISRPANPDLLVCRDFSKALSEPPEASSGGLNCATTITCCRVREFTLKGPTPPCEPSTSGASSIRTGNTVDASTEGRGKTCRAPFAACCKSMTSRWSS